MTPLRAIQLAVSLGGLVLYLVLIAAVYTDLTAPPVPTVAKHSEQQIQQLRCQLTGVCNI